MADVKANTAIVASAVLLSGFALASTLPVSAWADEAQENASEQVEQQIALNLETLYGPDWQNIVKKRHGDLLQEGAEPASDDATLVEAAKKDAVKTWKASASTSSLYYNNGEQVVPKLHLRYANSSKQYVPESLYQVVSCTPVSQVGEKGTVSISGTWDGTATRTLTFSVKQGHISEMMITRSKRAFYTGQEVKPAVEISYRGAKLVEGVDYRLEYSNNIEIGEARIDIYALGNFSGSGSCTFQIIAQLTPSNTPDEENASPSNTPDEENASPSNTPDEENTSPSNTPSSDDENVTSAPTVSNVITNASVAPIEARYTSGLSKVKPEVTVTVDGKTLTRGTDYTVTYKKNKKPGTAKAIVKGKGIYSGSATVSFKLVNLGDDLARMACKLAYSKASGRFSVNPTKAFMKAYNAVGRPNSAASKYNGRGCDATVSTICKYSGYDKKMPGGLASQRNYLGWNSSTHKPTGKGKSNGRWVGICRYTKNLEKQGKLLPGDIVFRNGHVCMYVGKSIAQEIYKTNLKGTKADRGKPGSTQTWVSGHFSFKGPCAIGSASGWAYPGTSSDKGYVFRLVKPRSSTYKVGGIVK